MANAGGPSQLAALFQSGGNNAMLSASHTADLSMKELKDELASLRIDRDAPRHNRWRVPLLLLVVIAVLIAGGFYWQRTHPVFGSIKVETFQPTVESKSG